MVLMAATARLFKGILFLWLGFVTTDGKPYADEPIFNKLTTSHGLSHNTVYAIAQDGRGFMWVGTREGLNRYDGNTIMTFYADPRDSAKLSSNHITALEMGGDGLLYAGTSQGLHVYNDRQGVFKRIYYKKIPAGKINKILRTADSTLLICSSQGLFALKKGQSELSLLVSNINAIDVVEFKRGVFWISTLQKILMINEHGEVLREYAALRNSSNQSVSLDNNIFCLFKDSFGDLWLGSKKDGLFKYDLEKDSFKAIITPYEFNPLEVNAIRAVSEDAQKRLWIGTESGLFIYDRTIESFRFYTQSFDQSPTTLGDKAIYAIYKSKE